MKILKMILLGLMGMVVSIIGYMLMLAYTNGVYGLVVSLLGSLTGAHAVLGYLGKDKIHADNFKTVSRIGVIFALLGSAAPYLIYSFDSASIIFIAIGAFGGYEFVIFLLRQHLNIKDKLIVNKSGELTFLNRIKIYAKKLYFVSRWYAFIALVCILIGKFLIPGFGVSWIVLAILLIYDIWRKKVYVITSEDVDGLCRRKIKR